MITRRVCSKYRSVSLSCRTGSIVSLCVVLVLVLVLVLVRVLLPPPMTTPTNTPTLLSFVIVESILNLI